MVGAVMPRDPVIESKRTSQGRIEVSEEVAVPSAISGREDAAGTEHPQDLAGRRRGPLQPLKNGSCAGGIERAAKVRALASCTSNETLPIPLSTALFRAFSIVGASRSIPTTWPGA